MDWAILAPAVFSLAGVAIGTVGSIIVGFYSTRTTRDQLRSQQETATRAELKESIIEYLRAMQTFHDYIGAVLENSPNIAQGDDRARDIARLDTEMWLYQKKLLLFADEPLRQASLRLSDTLNEAAYGEIPAGADFYDFIDPAQNQFLDAARIALGISRLSGHAASRAARTGSNA